MMVCVCTTISSACGLNSRGSSLRLSMVSSCQHCRQREADGGDLELVRSTDSKVMCARERENIDAASETAFCSKICGHASYRGARREWLSLCSSDFVHDMLVRVAVRQLPTRKIFDIVWWQRTSERQCSRIQNLVHQHIVITRHTFGDVWIKCVRATVHAYRCPRRGAISCMSHSLRELTAAELLFMRVCASEIDTLVIYPC